jgi:uncharacterized protein YndB with AHSA1/START domain
MRPHRHGSAVLEFPSTLEIVTTRLFDAPVALVFDVLTQPDHLRHWFAPFEDTMIVCEIDLRVGGDYHHVGVTPEGRECSFRGTFLEIESPTRVVSTWLFEGWPGAWATESVVLSESGAVTTMTSTLAFHDQTGRDHLTRFDGQESSYDNMEDYLNTLTRDPR